MDKHRQNIVLAVKGGHVVLISGDIHRNPSTVHQDRDLFLQSVKVPVHILLQRLKGLGLVPVITDLSVAHGFHNGQGAVNTQPVLLVITSPIHFSLSYRNPVADAIPIVPLRDFRITHFKCVT